MSAMERGVWLVGSQPSSADADAEYNEWYDRIHVPELLQVPGIVAARRFRVYPIQRGGGAPSVTHDYLAMYEIEAADIVECVEEVGRRSPSGDIRISPALRMSPPSSTVLYRGL